MSRLFGFTAGADIIVENFFCGGAYLHMCALSISTTISSTVERMVYNVIANFRFAGQWLPV